MKKFISFIAASVMILNSFIAPISILAQVPPSLTSADITSDGSKIGDLSGATLIINNVSGTVHTLNISNVDMNHPPNSEEYPFYLQANSSQQTTLVNYFASKSWPEQYLIQIGEEIKGIFPFFYFKVDNGNYSLVDGFKRALGSPNTDLVIDDDYPTGTYTYTGTVGSETKTITLTVSTASVELDAPKLISPLNNSSVNGTSLTNSWTAVTGAAKYIYESYHDSGLTLLRWSQEIPAPSTSKNATNVADSTFWWRVKAIDGNGNESLWSETWKVTVDNIAPETPMLLLPINGALVTGNPAQSWTAVSGADHYYYASFKDEMTTDQIYSTNVNGTNRTVSGNQTITIYWKVKAVDAAGNESGWSETRKLIIDNTVPSKPTGLTRFTPDGTKEYSCGAVSKRQTLIPTWNANTDPDFDHYEYTSFNPGGTIGINEQPLYTNRFVHTWVPTSDGISGYAVRAVDKAGNKSGWSLTGKSLAGSCQIRYDSVAPTAPTISSPTAEQIFKTSPILNKWSLVNDESGIKEYRVEYIYDDGHTFSGGPYRSTGTSTQRNHSPSPSEQGGVTIRVQAIDNAGNEGAWSDPVHYFYDATNPTGSWVTPTNNSTVSGTVSLNFNASDGAGSGVASTSYSYSSDGTTYVPISGNSWDTTELALDDYFLRAEVTDNAGNSADYDITVGVAAVISNQKSTTPTQTTAVISWDTDRPTTSRVVYDIVPHDVGSAPNYGYTYSTVTDTNHVKSHSVTIDGLSGGTTYYFRTISEGSPTAIGGESYFQTLTYAGAPASSWTSDGTVLGASTNLSPISNKLALAYENQPTGNKLEEVLGASTDSSETSNTPKSPISKANTENSTTNKNTWKITIAAGIIILLTIYGFYKLSKKK